MPFVFSLIPSIMGLPKKKEYWSFLEAVQYFFYLVFNPFRKHSKNKRNANKILRSSVRASFSSSSSEHFENDPRKVFNI